MDNELLLSFLIVSEILLILTAFAVYKVISKYRYAPVRGVSPTPDSVDCDGADKYFLDEMGRVSSELKSRDDAAPNDYEDINNLALSLRFSWLKLECDNLTKQKEINEIESDLIHIIDSYRIFAALKLLNDNEGYVEEEYKEIIAKQNKTIDFLKKYANEILAKILKKNEELIQDTDNEDYANKLTELNDEFKKQTEDLVVEIKNIESNNNEMNQCIGVLQEENDFLRKQVEQLLSLESNA